MTHFLVLAIVPKDCLNIEKWIESAMLPYNEQTPKTGRRRWHDYYRIGGRYDGIVTGNRRFTDLDGKPSDLQHGFNYGQDHESITNNMAKLGEVLYPASWGTPQHILTPEGKYVTKSRVGWWGFVDQKVEDAKWIARWKKIVEKYRDHQVVGLDCHI